MGDTHENGLELQKKMEKSERFRGPLINGRNHEKDPKTSAQLYKFDIVTYYTPAATHTDTPFNREGF